VVNLVVTDDQRDRVVVGFDLSDVCVALVVGFDLSDVCVAQRVWVPDLSVGLLN